MEKKLNEENICNIPDEHSLVYKDECVYCFDTMMSVCGLFICMKSFIGVCKNHLELFYKKSKNELFLNIKIEKRFKLPKEEAVGDKSEYQKFLKDMYFTKKFEIVEFHSLYLMPTHEMLSLPAELPHRVQDSIKKILNADCIAKACERGYKSENWEAELCPESKHSRKLLQLNNNVKIPPSGWKCEKCDLTNNLWLNLTDGSILCGRKFFDGTGGNNHAIEHFNNTSHPLAVKLGTITPQRADVFSYDEDSMVIDPLLSEHLAHFGIDIMKMEKTDKSVEEIEMENIKRNREQIAIMESDSNLEQLSGPGLTGIHNTGNSCYINSVVQVLFSIPAFVKFYSDRYEVIINEQDVQNDPIDFRVQMAKLGRFLKGSEYSYTLKPQLEVDGELIAPLPGITPQMFRFVIGRGHNDFSTKQQQDAVEFLIHLSEVIQRDLKKNNSNSGPSNPLESFVFRIEDRVYSKTTDTVKYQYREEKVLSLPIDLIEEGALLTESSSKGKEANFIEPSRAAVTLESCLRAFCADSKIEGYRQHGKLGEATLSSKLATFPDYLVIQLKRFMVGSDWMPKKLDVEVFVPDEIDISFMKATGKQPGEAGMPEEAEDNAIEPQLIYLNPEFIIQLLSMGFSENACKKAVYYTNNSSIDDAVNWLMIHVGEPDFDQLPLELAITTGMPDESDIQIIMTMGFSRLQAIMALKEVNNIELAVEWIFNHKDEIDKNETAMETGQNVGDVSPKKEEFKYSDGDPKYTLIGLISHMGNNAHVGHYVAHIKQLDGSWAFFNDDKVQRSANPPKKHAYLYLFKRTC